MIPRNPYEIVLIVLLIIFILSPIKLSPKIANSIDSTLGIIFFSILIVYLFVYNHGILAILFVIAVFELIRRSSKDYPMMGGNATPSIVNYTALQPTFSGQNLEQNYGPNQHDNTMVPVLAGGQNVMEASLQGAPSAPGSIHGRQIGSSREMLAANPEYIQAGQAEYLDYVADQYKRDSELMKTNTRLMETTLEEEVVHKVPSPRIEQDYLDSSYKPVYDNVHQASNV